MFRHAAIALAIILACAPAALADADMSKVDEILGRKPAVSGDVMRYGFPRSDLKVMVDGVAIKPALALGGWVSFKVSRGDSMLMGDLVLTETEINPVMAKLLKSGVEVTALHNHLLRANPPTFYMHVGGMGDPVKMATAIHDALALTATPMAVPGAASPPPVDLNTAALDKALGAKGKAVGGVYQFGIPRADVVSASGMPVPASMGSADGINFQPTGGGKAAITGDIVALDREVVPLITAMRENGIEVTAIHNHMLEDNPRTFYVHFWANDDAVKLATAMRKALDKTNVAR
jgi:hypothetical protein